jgi:hypothetical protein
MRNQLLQHTWLHTRNIELPPVLQNKRIRCHTLRAQPVHVALAGLERVRATLVQWLMFVYLDTPVPLEPVPILSRDLAAAVRTGGRG